MGCNVKVAVKKLMNDAGLVKKKREKNEEAKGFLADKRVCPLWQLLQILRRGRLFPFGSWPVMSHDSPSSITGYR